MVSSGVYHVFMMTMTTAAATKLAADLAASKVYDAAFQAALGGECPGNLMEARLVADEAGRYDLVESIDQAMRAAEVAAQAAVKAAGLA
jgi:hypothetical protein